MLRRSSCPRLSRFALREDEERALRFLDREPLRDAAAAERRRRRLQGEKMTDGLDAPGIILLIVFVPMLFIILWYAQGCCRPKQVVPT